jgi:hypothetical protein
MVARPSQWASEITLLACLASVLLENGWFFGLFASLSKLVWLDFHIFHSFHLFPELPERNFVMEAQNAQNAI